MDAAVKQKSMLGTEIVPTTLVRSARLNQRLNADVFLACETFQITGSFKYRAALNVVRNTANDKEPKTVADGVRTVSVGAHNWPYLKAGLAQVLEVSEQSIIKAWKMLLLLANVKAEPTGGVALAGLLENQQLFAGQRICCVVSGGNIDPCVLQELLRGDEIE